MERSAQLRLETNQLYLMDTPWLRGPHVSLELYTNRSSTSRATVTSSAMTKPARRLLTRN